MYWLMLTHELMANNITAHYKKVKDNTVDKINSDAKIIASKLNIEDREEKIAQRNAFITVKDHKPQFPNDIKCRLINPTKSNIGKISKQLLDLINATIMTKLDLKLLKNSAETIEWFKNTEFKPRKSFIQFDIVDYYPSISKVLFDKVLLFASENTTGLITPDSTEIFENARQSILCYNSQIWQKNTGPFDITMGAFDGAQITDLVGLYILNELKEKIPEIEFGLYRDDGLGIHRRIPPSQIDKIRKKLFKIFDEMGLKITVETNLARVDFLDITMELTSETYQPFRKPNDTPLYVNAKSNHPPHVLKNIKPAINKRLTELSSNELLFNQAKGPYEEALNKSGHPSKLRFEKSKQTKKKNRSRKTIFYNPPYSSSMKTKFGNKFLLLIDKHFPKNNPLHKIINRKTIKISYSCCPNVSSIISAHNKKILTNKVNELNSKKCNCRNPSNCPLDGNCCISSVIYRADIEHPKAFYIGMTARKFKERFNQHKHSFKSENRKKCTTLSDFIWTNKLNPEPQIKWSIVKQCQTYEPGKASCDLCTSEKAEILKHINNPQCINRRNDLNTKCLHMRATRIGQVT